MEGSLLVAHPLLNDGFFNRSVVYLTSQGEDGSLGFILNFKTSFKLRDVRPQVRNGNFPIYEGGPVAKDQLFFIHTLGNNISDSQKIKNNIYFGGDFNEMLHMIDHGKVRQHEVRFFAGYSGWGYQQLEKEISTKSWLLNNDATPEMFLISNDNLWKQKLSEVKNSYSIFADIGFDPSLN